MLFFNWTRWLRSSRIARGETIQKKIKRVSRLALETLEDRLAPSTLPAPDVSNQAALPSQPAATLPGSNPLTNPNVGADIAIDPFDSSRLVAVSSFNPTNLNQATPGVRYWYSTDAGATWSFPTTIFNLSDPNLFNAPTVFANVDDANVVFDQLHNFYIVCAQRSLSNDSGALVLSKFSFNGPTPTQVDLQDPDPLNFGLSKVLHRWFGQDPAYNPVVAIDTNVPNYTDPVTGLVQTDSMAHAIARVTFGAATGTVTFSYNGTNTATDLAYDATTTTAAQVQANLETIPELAGNVRVTANDSFGGPFAILLDNRTDNSLSPRLLTVSGAFGQIVVNPKAIYVAWNTQFTQPQNSNPAISSRVWITGSADGGINFSTTQFVSDAFFGTGASAPQIAFTQGTPYNPALPGSADIPGGQMVVVFNGSTTLPVTYNKVFTDISSPDGGVPSVGAVGAHVFTNTLIGNIIDATVPGTTPPNNTPGVSPGPNPLLAAPFQIAVDITDPNFNAVVDVDVTVNIRHDNVAQLGIVLVPPAGSGLPSITLLNPSLNFVNGNGINGQGLPAGANLGVIVGGAGPQIRPMGTVFDEQAERSIRDQTANGTLRIGHFQPEFGLFGGGLSSLNGLTAEQIRGTWTLQITDNIDDGNNPTQSIRGWSINFTSRIDTSDPNFFSTGDTTGFGFDSQNPSFFSDPNFQNIAGTTVNGGNGAANAQGIHQGVGNSYQLVNPVSGTPGIAPGLSLAIDNTLGSFSPHQGTIYVAYTGYSNRSNITRNVNDTDVFLMKSSDGGLFWDVNPNTGFQQFKVNDDSDVFGILPNDNFSEGNRTQFMPNVAVDQTTGTVVVSYYDARWDAARIRTANSLAVSIDGGNTFGVQSFISQPKQAIDPIRDPLATSPITIEPVPGNQSQANFLGFGDRQGLVVAAGKAYPAYASNLNDIGSQVYTAIATFAAGPRLLYKDNGADATDMGPVVAAFTVTVNGIPHTYNNTFTADGRRQLDAFRVTFDRPIDPNSFDASDVTVIYRDPNGGNQRTIALDPTKPIEPLDLGGVSGFGYGARQAGSLSSVNPLATQFLIHLATPQSATGTYSYAIGPNINDLVGSVTPPPSATGALDQYASSVIAFSSEFGSSFTTPPGSWSTAQTLGPPDTPFQGDIGTAWAAATANSGANEGILIGYTTPVHAYSVTVTESFNPGFVTLIGLIDTLGNFHVVFDETIHGPDPTGPGVVGNPSENFRWDFPITTYLAEQVIIFVDTLHNPGVGQWEEIDAVLLSGATGSNLFTATGPANTNLRLPPVGTGASVPAGTFPPPANNDTVVSTITVGGLTGPLTDIDVHVQINYPISGDLEMRLVAPDGTVVPLAIHQPSLGNGGNDYGAVRFDDEASDTFATSSTPYGGVRPISFAGPGTGLTVLDGMLPAVANGTWQLQVKDDNAGNIGTLISWSLVIGTAAAIAPPAGNSMDQNNNGVTAEGNVDTFAVPRPTSGIPFGGPYDLETIPLILPGPHLVYNETETVTIPAGVTQVIMSFGGVPAPNPLAFGPATTAAQFLAHLQTIPGLFMNEQQMINNTSSLFPIPLGGSVVGASDTAPIVVTTGSPHGRVTGDVVSIAGVQGNTAANGNFTVTVLTPTTFELNGSTGSGAYTPGTGTWRPVASLTFGLDGTLATPLVLNGAISGASNTSPIVIQTVAPHGLVTGEQVTITGVLGNTGANGTRTVTVVSPTSFSLDFSAGNGVYTSGGTWSTALTAAKVQAALETIPALAGNVLVSGFGAGPFVVSFINGLQGTDVSLLTATVTPVGRLVFISETVKGGGGSNVTVSGPAGGPYAVTFINQLGDQDIALGLSAASVIPAVFPVTVVETHKGGPSDNLVFNSVTNSLNLTFDRDMNRSSFTIADLIQMVGPTVLGSGAIGGLSLLPTAPPGTPPALANRTFQILFPTQNRSGSYAMIVGADIQANEVRSAANVAPGSGYTVNDILTLVGGTFATPTRVQVTAVNGTGGVTGFALFAPGSYSVQPATPMTVTGGSGTGATFTQTYGLSVDTNLNAGLDALRGTGIAARVTSQYNANLSQAVPIPAGQTVTSKLIVPDFFVIQQDGTHHIQVQLKISHQNVPDLEGQLIAPDGTVIQLFTRVGVFGSTPHANFNDTLFDDFAINPIQNAGTPIPTGPFNPQLPLSALDGLGSQFGGNGAWTLSIKNNGTIAGTIDRWSLYLPKSAPTDGLGELIADQLTPHFRIFTQDPTQVQSSSEWTAVGPAPHAGSSGRIGGIAVDPSDPTGNTVFVSGASGGVWKTSNFFTSDPQGPTFVNLTDFGPNTSLRTGSIAVFGRSGDPNQSIVIVGTGEPDAGFTGIGFLRSMDGGKTWQVLDSTVNQAGANAPADPTDPDRIARMHDTVQALPGGVAGGVRDHLFVGSSTFKLIVDPTPQPNGQVAVYAAMVGNAANEGLWRSLDTGKTWIRIRAGRASDVFLAAGSRDGDGNLDKLYAAFVGEGVFFTPSPRSAQSLTRLDGNQAGLHPLFRDVDPAVDVPIPVTAPSSTPTGNRGRMVIAGPHLMNNPLQDILYQGWLYVAIANLNGSLDAVYMTKDFGVNWTRLRIPQVNPFAGTAFPTNDESRPDYNPLDVQGNYNITLAVDPNNPNIVYLGGQNFGPNSAAGGTIRIDVTTMSDPYAMVAYDNSDPGTGPIQFTANTGAVTTKAAGTNSSGAAIGPGRAGGMAERLEPPGGHFTVYPGLPGHAAIFAGNFMDNSIGGYYSLLRDPQAPFRTPSSLQFTNIARFNNDGADVKWMPFNDALNFSADQHELVVLRDPLTGETRLIFGDDQGVFTGVSRVSDGTFLTNLGTSPLAFGSRNGNLQLSQLYEGAAQPSVLAADIAGSFFYGSAQDTGFPKSGPNVLGTGDLTWAGTWGDAAGVATDPTGSGTSYQYRFPCCINEPGFLASDFFLVQLPNGPLVGRTNGLLQPGDDPESSTGQWPAIAFGSPLGNTPMANFAVNPVDGTALLISSQAGRIFRTSGPTTGTGVQWFEIGTPTAAFPAPGATGNVDNIYKEALAFGSPRATTQTNPLDLDQRPAGSLNDFIYAGSDGGRMWVTFSSGGPGGWRNISGGLDGSPIQAIVPNPRRDSHEVYAVTTVGVYWLADSSVPNPTWVRLNEAAFGKGSLFNLERPVWGNLTDTWPTLQRISSLAVDWRFNIPDPTGTGTHPILYVAGNGGVFRSTDKGDSWNYFPAQSFDEVQTVSIPATVTQLTFSFHGVPGSVLNFSPATTAADLQSNLESIAVLAGNVSVSGTPGGPFTVTFKANQGHRDVPLLAANVVAGAGVVTVSETVLGGPGRDEQQTVTVPAGVTAVTFNFNGLSGATLLFNPSTTAAQVQANLQTIPALGLSANVSVSGPAGGPYVVTFVNGQGNKDVPMLGAAAVGGTVTVEETVKGSVDDGSNQLGGYLPNNHITDLDLSLGNINTSTGFPDETSGLNMLVATTFGRGMFAIRLDNRRFEQFAVNPNFGPRVLSSQPDAANSGINVNFSGNVDPVTFTLTDIVQNERQTIDITGPALISFAYAGSLTNAALNYTSATTAADIQANLLSIPALSINEQQRITIPAAVTSLTFNLDGVAATPLAFNSATTTAAEVQANLLTIPALTGQGGFSNISVGGPVGGPFLVTFAHSLKGVDVSILQVTAVAPVGNPALVTEILKGGTNVIVSTPSHVIADASNTADIVITSPNHGLATGNQVVVSGALGNTNANGTFTVTVLSPDTFELDGSSGNGAYTGGGSWKKVGQFVVTFRYKLGGQDVLPLTATSNPVGVVTIAESLKGGIIGLIDGNGNPMVPADVTELTSSGAISGVTNTSPIRITSFGHGLNTGTQVTIQGVIGNSAANGTFIITVIDNNTFSLNGSTGNGTYIAGGTWVRAHNLYRITLAPNPAPGVYTFNVGPFLSDFAGNLMNQDEDGTKGEVADDIYSGRVFFQPFANLPPTLTAGSFPFAPSILEDDILNFGSDLPSFLASLPAGAFGDGNDPAYGPGFAPRGIAVTGVGSSANGVWQYSLDGGTNWLSFGAPTALAARLLDVSPTTRVRFLPKPNFNGSESFSFVAWDQTVGAPGGTANSSGGGTGTSAFSGTSATATIIITPVNDAPVNTVPGTQNLNEDVNLVFSAANGNAISVSDVDDLDVSNPVVGDQTVRVTLTVLRGALTLNGAGGLAFTVGDGTADTTMTFSGSLANVRAALNGLTYTPATNSSLADQLTITTDDLGNFGMGAPLSDTDTVDILINAVNDAPVNNLPGPQATIEDNAIVFSTTNGNAITVSDVDDLDDTVAGNEILQVSLSITNGSITLGTIAGLTFSAGDGTADAAMTFTGTINAINTALNGLRYVPTLNFNAPPSTQLTIATNDQGSFGGGGAQSDTDVMVIDVTPANDAPINVVPGAQTVAEDANLVFSGARTISVSDVDDADNPNSNIGDQPVQITLTAPRGLITLSTIAGLAFSAGDGTADSTMTFTGTTGAVNTALAGLIYRSAQDLSGPDTLTIITDDLGNRGLGGPLTDTDVIPITVTPFNDAPVNTVPGTQTIAEDTSRVFSAANGNLIAVGDPDDGDDLVAGNETVQVTLSVTRGTMSLSGIAGLTFSVGDGTADTAMTFSGTIAAINTALDGLTYTPDLNFAGTDTLTIVTDDGGNFGAGVPLSDSDGVSIVMTPVNDAPVNIILPTSPHTVPEDTAVFFTGATRIAVSDVDDADDTIAGNETMEVSLAVTHGVLTLSGIAGLAFTVGDGTADTAMTFTGTIAAINAALDGMSYTPDAAYLGAAQLDMAANDLGNFGAGVPESDADTLLFNVAPVNDAPVNTVPGPQTMVEDTTLTLTGANRISIDDPDDGDNGIPGDMVVQVTLSSANGTSTLAGTGGLTFTAGDGTADATMTFSGTLNSINAALSTVVFTPATSFAGNTSLVVATDDLGNIGIPGPITTTSTIPITVTQVNDAPVNVVPTSATTPEDTDLVFTGPNLISVGDVDDADNLIAGDEVMEVSLSVNNGILTLASVAGLTITSGTNGSSSMAFFGTIANLRAALNGMRFTPTLNFAGSATLNIATGDFGNFGTGTPLGDADSVPITITAVNDAPVNVITLPTQPDLVEDNTRTFSGGNRISISDVDDLDNGSPAGDMVMQVTLSAAHGVLRLNGLGGLSFSPGVGDGFDDATMTFTGSLADINAALDGLIYTPNLNFNGAETLTITTNDLGGNPPPALSDTDNLAINVTAVNDAPVNTVPGGQSTDEDIARVFSTANGNLITVGDVDDGDDASPGNEVLRVTLSVLHGSLTLSTNAGLSFTTGDGVNDATMTFRGGIAAINAALSGLTYLPASNYNGADTLSLNTEDEGRFGAGGPQSDLDTVAINVVAVNDAPLNIIPGSQTFNEDTPRVFSAAAGRLIAVSDVDDADNGTAGDETVEVTLAAAHGTMTLATTASLAFGAGDGAGDATMTFTGSISAVNAALNGLTYVPNANYNGADALTITTNDLGNVGLPGPLSDSDPIAITLAAINDAPENNVPAAQSFNEDTVRTFSSATGNQISIADVDDLDNTTPGDEQLRVTLSVASGVLSLSGIGGLGFSAGDGTADASMTFTGALSAINAALNGMTYTPNSNFNGADGLTITTNDLGNFGASSALSDTDTVPLTVIAVNDAPVNAVPGPQTINEDSSLVLSGATRISVSDADDLDNGTPGDQALQVTLSVNSGVLSLGSTGGLSFSTGDGTGDALMTFTGTLSAINAALASLTYAPALNFNGAETLTITSNDLGTAGIPGAQSATNTVAITVNPVNDVPSFIKGADQAVLEDALAQTVVGWATSILAYPASPAPQALDEGGQALDFIVTTNNPALFSAGPAIAANGTLTFTPAPNANGIALVTVRLHDNGGGTDTSAPQTFTIAVTAVNDAPSFNVNATHTVSEDAVAQNRPGWAFNILAGPPDEVAAGQTVSFTATNNNNALFAVQPAIDASGTLTYQPAVNANGSATVSVTARDSGGGADTSAPQTFTINVTAVNDTPSFVKGPDQTLPQNSPGQTVPNWATAILPYPPAPAAPAPDENGQAIDFIVTNNNAGLFAVQPAVNAVGTLTFTPLAGASGTALVSVQVHDNGGGADTSAVQTFNINITTASTTALSLVRNPSVIGETITISALVTPNNGSPITPTGTVTFVTATRTLGSNIPLDAAGRATITINDLTLGAHDITATYSGSTRYGGSGDTRTQTVNRADTQVSISSSLPTSIDSQNVTFTATVVVAAPGSTVLGAPTGTVTFVDITTSTNLGTVPLVGSQASVSTNNLAVGNHTIQATFNSTSGNFNSSPPASLTQTVAPHPAAFVVVPGSVKTGTPFTVVVHYLKNGAPDASFNGPVALAINSGPGNLIGGGTATASGGVATFNGLQLDRAGSYTLAARVPGLRDVISPTIEGTALSLVSALSPGRPVINKATKLSLTAVDFTGNIASNFNGSFAVQVKKRPIGGKVLNRTGNFAGGVANLSNLRFTKVGRYTLVISVNGLTLTINVNAGLGRRKI